MYFKIEETYLYTESAYIEADSIEEAKEKFHKGQYSTEDDDNCSMVSSILFKPSDNADLSEIDDISYASDINDWDTVAGYSDIKFEKERYD